MRGAGLAILLAAVVAAPASAATPLVGEAFSCEPAGRVVAVVGRIDRLGAKTVASVSLFDQVPGSPLADVGHIPIEVGALRAGCRAIARKHPLSDNFEAGYATWREAFDAGKGGYFTVTVEAIIDDLLLQTPREGGDL